MKIHVAGDIHGDWPALNSHIAKHRPDIILQCGDFGWWPKFDIFKPLVYHHQVPWKHKGVKPGSSIIYWCDGNHEEHPKLVQDGQLHQMQPQIFHGSRGSVFKLPDGRIVLFAGGAASIDKDARVAGHDWYPEELITQADLTRLLDHKHIDIVISHTCPESFEIEKPKEINDKIDDPSRLALQVVLEHYKPSLWYFGHWHRHKRGTVDNTLWTALDYPAHGGRWWINLDT